MANAILQAGIDRVDMAYTDRVDMAYAYAQALAASQAALGGNHDGAAQAARQCRRTWRESGQTDQKIGDLIDDLVASAESDEADALNQQRARNTVIVTRHPALVEWLQRSGRVATSVQVVTHATADDVRDKFVFGVLPLHLAAEAKSVTEVMLDIPAERRGQELTLDDMNRFVRGVQTYRVTKLGFTGE